MMRFGFGRGFDRWFTRAVLSCAAVSLLAVPGPSGADPNDHLPKGLRPTEQNISNDPDHKYGEMQIAINPTNPDNMVSIWVKDSFTLACVTSGDPNCQPVNRIIQGPPPLPIGPGPAGYFFGGPRWVECGLFVSFNHGQSWTRVELPLGPLPEFDKQGDCSVTVGPDGTFYAAWDIFNWNVPLDALKNGGIAASKSTDGGLTWSPAVLTGTALDNPKIITDRTTGRVYEASQGAFGSKLATGNPSDPLFPPGIAGDRYVVASADGVSWGPPRGIGGSNGTTYFTAGIGPFNPFMSAAHGVLAAAFRSTNAAACSFFVGTGAPCIVFQTTVDDGATWTRHAVPSSVITGNVSVAADPTMPGHYTIVGSNSTSSGFVAYQTFDSGATWTGPSALVADPAPFAKTFLWVSYSESGTLGMTWRANQAVGSTLNVPFLSWATISDDGGATFYRPLQMSAAPTPPNPAGQSPGDDYSNVQLSDDRLFASWPDRRPGERAAFVGTVNLQAFRHIANQ